MQAITYQQPQPKQAKPKFYYIADLMRRDHIKKALITAEDLGMGLERGWGTVLPVDIGKMCVISNGLFYMENNEQRDTRIAKEKK